MKLITLNTWCGVIYEPLVEFVKKYSADVDIFCFQEVFNGALSIRQDLGNVRADLFSDLQAILPDFNGYHAPTQENDDGLAIFIKKSFTVNKTGDIFVHRYLNAMMGEDGSTMGRNLQYLEFNHSNKIYTILNFHGMWAGAGVGKIDTEERILQSNKVREFFNESKGNRILCGDFNLGPNTKSIAILNEGNRNLVQEYKVTSTRSSVYTKPVKFADYIITSPEVEVKDFKVLSDEVSDHLPLFIEFN
jgi:endonuclease/exonuclease/phosphatase family metal-dependent hydrolase